MKHGYPIVSGGKTDKKAYRRWNAKNGREIRSPLENILGVVTNVTLCVQFWNGQKFKVNRYLSK